MPDIKSPHHKIHFFSNIQTYNGGHKLSRQLRKWCCPSSDKKCKTLFKDHMMRLKIISLYIYKDLRLMILGIMSHVTIITRYIIMRMAT